MKLGGAYKVRFEPGDEIVGRYTVVRKVGEGSYGIVYEATQHSTRQRVAIKLLKHQPSAEAQSETHSRFAREIETMGKLHHPNSIRLLDSGLTDDGARFVVLEFLEGVELKDEIDKGPLSPKLARHVIMAVLGALAEAHQQGFVHRDIKPANIMLTGNLTHPGVKVLDFGIAAIQEGFRSETYEQLTMAGQTRGTPAYMAPEQLAGNETTARSDIYATGLVLLECLIGRRAVVGATAVDTCLKQLQGDIDFPAEVRRTALGQVVARAVSKLPTDRYQDAEEMLAALDAIEISGIVDISQMADVGDGRPRTMALPSIPPIDQGGGNDAFGNDAATQALPLPDAASLMQSTPNAGGRVSLDSSPRIGLGGGGPRLLQPTDGEREIVDDGMATQAMAAIPMDSAQLALGRMQQMDGDEVTIHVKHTEPMKAVTPDALEKLEKRFSPTAPPHIQRLPTPPQMPAVTPEDPQSTVARLLVLLALVLAVLMAAGAALFILGYI